MSDFGDQVEQAASVSQGSWEKLVGRRGVMRSGVGLASLRCMGASRVRAVSCQAAGFQGLETAGDGGGTCSPGWRSGSGSCQHVIGHFSRENG